MLEGIVNLVKDQVLPAITNNTDIPQEKQEDAVQTTTSTILAGLKDHLIPDNMSEVMNLFGKNSSLSSFGNHAMVQGIQSSVASALVQKVGLNAGIANTIANAVVPAVVNMFSKKVNDDNEPGFSVESLIQSFSKEGNGKSSGGILDMIGGLFGGK